MVIIISIINVYINTQMIMIGCGPGITIITSPVIIFHVIIMIIILEVIVMMI